MENVSSDTVRRYAYGSPDNILMPVPSIDAAGASRSPAACNAKAAGNLHRPHFHTFTLNLAGI